MHHDDNPFDQLGLDPRSTPRQLTEALRARAERALPEERQRLQNLWRQLTLKEADRLRFALLAHPRARDASSDQIDALAKRVPPSLSRAKLPPLTVSPADLLVLPPLSDPKQLPVRPPALPPHDGGADA